MTAPPIAMLDLDALHAPLRPQLEAAVARVIEDGRFVLGPDVEAFESEFAGACGAPFAVSCGSGSDALLLALAACDVGPGDQVICPAYSFFATASSIERLGAQSVFADIDPHSFNLAPESVREAARACSRLRAIVPVDLFGRPCDLDELLGIAEDLGVPLIEDAAQSVGARDEQGHPVGARSTFACFSLYPTKNLGGLGDGGILTTADPRLAERVAALRCHGSRAPYRHDELGINSRLDTIQAAVLRIKLACLEEWTKVRGENAARYDDGFQASGAAQTMDALDDAHLPLLPPRPAPPSARHAYHQYVVRVPAARRDRLRAHLQRNSIASEIYYPVGLHRQPCFAGRETHVALHCTDTACREALALPVHPNLTPGQIDRVIACVVEGLAGPQ